MQRSNPSPSDFLAEEPFDIFSKYTKGAVSSFMPFKLFSQDDISQPARKAIKRNTRGPYRKYSENEKKTIIHRILRGETLKSIAEETKIPKRNLIRWKHEYLVGQKFDLDSYSSQILESDTTSKEAKSGSLLETKQALSQSSIKPSKTEE